MRQLLCFDWVAFQDAMSNRGFKFNRNLAYHVGVSESYVRMVQAGTIPSPEVRSRFAAVLGVREKDLWVAVRRRRDV